MGTITECRSSFIEAYTDKVKDESKWARAALLMGNSVEAWKEHYAITLKRRRCQEGIDAFATEFLEEEGVENESSVVMELPRKFLASGPYGPHQCIGLSVEPTEMLDISGDFEFVPW